MKRIILFILTLLVTMSAFAEGTVIRTISGNGIKNTIPFKVSDGWEIQWDATGSYFGIYLYKSNGELINVAANQAGSGKGSSYQPTGGEYYLQINAIGMASTSKTIPMAQHFTIALIFSIFISLIFRLIHQVCSAMPYIYILLFRVRLRG